MRWIDLTTLVLAWRRCGWRRATGFRRPPVVMSAGLEVDDPEQQEQQDDQPRHAEDPEQEWNHSWPPSGYALWGLTAHSRMRGRARRPAIRIAEPSRPHNRRPYPQADAPAGRCRRSSRAQLRAVPRRDRGVAARQWHGERGARVCRSRVWDAHGPRHRAALARGPDDRLPAPRRRV